MAEDTTYQRFYSASDVQIVISDSDSKELLTLDLATGIGFNESAPMEPIYGLSYSLPSFFVRKNSIVTGFIGIAYKYEAYLRKTINYVNGISESASTTKVSYEDSKITTYDQLQAAIEERSYGTNRASGASTLGAQSPFHITIIFSTGSVNDKFESITIGPCFLIGRSVMINSDGENPVSEGFSFIASQIL